MPRLDLISFGQRMGEQVSWQIKNATAPLRREIADLSARIAEIPAGPQGEQGERGLPGDSGRDGKDGRDGVNGKDGRDGERGERGATGERGERGQDGRSVSIDEVRAMLETMVSAAVSAAVLDVERRYQGAVEKAIERLPTPRDGRDGINGKDGRDGVDGKDGAPGTNGRDGVDGKDGSDGNNGRDGTDGLGFDDLDLEYDGERSFVLTARRGDLVKEKRITVPVIIDRGIYTTIRVYERGDGVTYGGDYWIAARYMAAGESPGKSDGWRLAVRKGRDGRRGS